MIAIGILMYLVGWVSSLLMYASKACGNRAAQLTFAVVVILGVIGGIAVIVAGFAKFAWDNLP